MGKLIITKQQNHLCAFLFDQKEPYMLQTASLPESETLLGNIYLARIEEVVPSLNGAFASIGDGRKVFLPLKECKNPLLANREYEADAYAPKVGDELVLQIIEEALKTKLPMASARLELKGQYCICKNSGHGMKFSSKLTEVQKNRIKEILSNHVAANRKKYQFTIRTNAGDLDDYTVLLQEMESFIHTFEEINTVYRHRTVFTCFYSTPPDIIQKIKDFPGNFIEELITDIPSVYNLCISHMSGIPVRFYEDELLSLSKLYSLDTHISQILSKKVWLSCGGYLIIEPTEAMIVIDVNSGKSASGVKTNKNFALKVNLEAAREVARQLRLRNYSGIIMVDFINMNTDEEKEKLLTTLSTYLKEDKVYTRLIDMTPLGIVEITRKKTSKPTADYFNKIT